MTTEQGQAAWSEQCAPHLQPQRVLSALRATCSVPAAAVLGTFAPAL